MEHYDLISALHPPGGWYALCGIKEVGKLKQRLFDNLEDLRQQVEVWKADHDVYFGVATYATGDNRLKGNVASLKAFWLDLDCGPTKGAAAPGGRPKGYLTKRLAALALAKFCEELDLPEPTLVDTGGGIHVYWVLEESITREQWETTAAVLKEHCVSRKLYADLAVFEVARILRVPDTFNHKTGTPRPTRLMHVGEPVAYADFCAALGTAPTPITVAPQAPATPRLKSAMGEAFAAAEKEFNPTSFTKIVNQCRQIAHCRDNAATLEEPMWRAALSVATLCMEREEAMLAVSDGHPDYSPAATEEKARGTKGAYSCLQFDNLNPGGCKGCPKLGKIKTPMSLGTFVPEAAPGTIFEEDLDDTVGTSEDGHTMPEGYYRGEKGGVYRRGGDESEDIQVCPMFLCIAKRLRDPSIGDVLVMRLHTKKDGIREFVVPNTFISDKSEVRKALAAQGVVPGDRQFNEVMAYIRACIDDLNDRAKADSMRLQFGWADKDSKFILGDREITATGTAYSPPSAATTASSELMRPEGTLEGWKEVFNLYSAPGLEGHAFGALVAFAAPLFKFLGQKGAIVNIIHPRSGTGKTTILHMCNSVYGAPDKLCGVKDDTANARTTLLGIQNNLPFTIDEMTNMKAEDFSAMVYNMTQGKGKDRMKQHTNTLRHNATSWQTISLCSSNSSFVEKLSILKASPDGELMRLFEYSIGYSSVLDPAYAKEMFDRQLLANYGHAGPIYLGWLVPNLEEALDTLRNLQVKIDDDLKFTQGERFWSALITCIMCGGLISKRLGLHDYDMKAIYAYAAKQVLRMREDTTLPTSNVPAIIGDFINSNTQNILVVNNAADARTNVQAMPKQEPRGDLKIRFEPDTKLVYIATGSFREYCAQRQLHYRDILRTMTEIGLLRSSMPKRISKGMKLSAPPVNCLELDFQHEAFDGVATLTDAVVEVHEADGTQEAPPGE